MIDRKGFTLLELIIVMAVIMILSQFILASTIQSRKKATKSSCINNLRQIGMASNLYSMDYKGKYPTDGFDEKSQSTQPLLTLASKNYLPYEMIICPSSGAKVVNNNQAIIEYYYITNLTIYDPSNYVMAHDIPQLIGDAPKKPGDPRILGTYHGVNSKPFNVLFMDGHVESLNYNSLKTGINTTGIN